MLLNIKRFTLVRWYQTSGSSNDLKHYDSWLTAHEKFWGGLCVACRLTMLICRIYQIKSNLSMQKGQLATNNASMQTRLEMERCVWNPKQIRGRPMMLLSKFFGVVQFPSLRKWGLRFRPQNEPWKRVEWLISPVIHCPILLKFGTKVHFGSAEPASWLSRERLARRAGKNLAF